eukprot:13066977-Ditylum_brightwellii.AAC.1
MTNTTGSFLKHYTKLHSGQSRNLVPDYPRSVFLWTIKPRLNLKENLLTTQFARRSTATALADTGISMTNLKRVGRWKSDKVAEGYLENSKMQKKEQMKMLDAEPPKKKKSLQQ